MPENSRRVNRWYPGFNALSGPACGDAVERYQRTSAVRHNIAKRTEYASGLTDVSSASTRTRPVSGYLINDSAEPDQLRGLLDGHGAWSRCVASGEH
jgi:hypothetical protein